MTEQVPPAPVEPPTLNGLDDPLLADLAAAAVGDGAAIGRIAVTSDGVMAVIRNRLSALVAYHMERRGLTPPEEWLRILRQTVVQRIFLEEGLSALGETLGGAGIPWLPLKGMGLVAQCYPQPECRPTSDLDILIPEQRFLEVRELLRSEGWSDLHSGPLHEDFLLREGYNWQARHTSGIMLELHFRLWGPVDPGMARWVFERAEPAPAPGGAGLLGGPVESHVVAACHLWNSPRPVALLYFLDLHLLAQRAADDPGFATAVIETARRFDVQSFVGLAAAVTSRLWPDEANERIARTLLGELRLPERLGISLVRQPATSLSLGALVFPRLLARRRSRSGWRAPFRQLWPHPAVFQHSNARGPIAAVRRAFSPRNREHDPRR